MDARTATSADIDLLLLFIWNGVADNLDSIGPWLVSIVGLREKPHRPEQA
jgi:hypothetical protein